jgi:hypothetical protein
MNTTVTKPLLTDETGKEVVDGLKLIAKRVAEQGSSFYYELRIEIETGSICRAVTGAKVKEAVSVNGEAVLYLDQLGTWIVTGETPAGRKMVTEIVTADAPGIHYLTARFNGIYGVRWAGTASTACVRTDDSAALDEPVSYVAGMVAGEYGSPYDEIQPWASMHIVEDEAAGTLVAIPKFWYKLTIAADKSIEIKIAAYPADGFKVSPAHMDRGDGKGEREVVYIGRYHCGGGYKSMTGVKPMASKARAAFRSGIHELGDDIWQNDIATRITLWLLYLVEYADWNTQKTIGYGCGNNSSTENMGASDAMPYHTGTMMASKTEYGVGVQYRNIEGLWDNVYDWCDGIYFNDTEVYVMTNPADFSDTTNGTLVCARPASSGYISAWQQAEEPFDWFIYPAAMAGGGESYVGDYCYYAAGGVVLCYGGSYSRSQAFGLFCLLGDGGASSAVGNVGSRLLKLP